MFNILRTIFCIPCLFCLHTTEAQLVYFENLSTRNGLPSSEVFDIVQDYTGNIWFATSSGICVHDGYCFKTYDVSEKTLSNTVLGIKSDSQGRLWFTSGDGSIGHINKGRAVILCTGDHLRKSTDFLHIMNFVPDQHGNVIITTDRGARFRINAAGIPQPLHLPRKAGHNLAFLVSNDTFYYEYQGEGAVAINPQKIKTEPGRLFHIRQDLQTAPEFIRFAPSDSQEFYVSVNNVVYHFKSDTLHRHRVLGNRNPVTAILFDNKHNLWVSQLTERTLIFSQGDLLSNPQSQLEGDIISKIFQDQYSDYWIASNLNGVFHTSSIAFKILRGTENLNIISIDFHQGSVFYSKYSHGLFFQSLIQDRSKDPDIIDLDFVNNPRYQIKEFSIYAGKIWTAGTDFFCFNVNGKQKTNLMPGHTYSVETASFPKVLLGGLFFYAVYDARTEVLHHYSIPGKKVNAIWEDSKGNVLLGTNDGLYITRPGTEPDSLHRLCIFPVTDITGSGESVWVGTEGSGVLRLGEDDTVLITTTDGLLNDCILSLFAEDKHTLWVGTRKGLSCIREKNQSIKRWDVTNYTQSDGLPANEINDIGMDSGVLYLATERGVIYVETRDLNKKRPLLSVQMNAVIVDATDTITLPTPKLNSEKNTIKFVYRALGSLAGKNIRFRYRLDDYNNHWLTTSTPEVIFRKLPPGNYCFRISASTNGITYGPELSYAFSISRPFTASIQFFLLLIGITAILTLTIIRLINRIRKRREDSQLQLMRVENNALRMQMNPHFIFNVLVSVQDHIRNERSDVAASTLLDLSSLVRQVLEHSKRNFVPLCKELDYINLYMSIEKSRRLGNIQFSIHIDQEIDVDNCNIPPMMLQPFVENAIWHGLLPKNSDRTLEVRFSKADEDHILCEFIDNGVGRHKQQGRSVKQGLYSPTGIRNVQTRIQTMNALYGSRMLLEFIDLGTIQQPLGTHIVLILYHT